MIICRSLPDKIAKGHLLSLHLNPGQACRETKRSESCIHNAVGLDRCEIFKIYKTGNLNAYLACAIATLSPESMVQTQCQGLRISLAHSFVSRFEMTECFPSEVQFREAARLLAPQWSREKPIVAPSWSSSNRSVSGFNVGLKSSGTATSLHSCSLPNTDTT